MFSVTFASANKIRMYQALTFYHSSFRWLVLASMVYAIYRAYRGYTSKSAFSKTDNAVRHWTATVAHIQLAIGLVLYFRSPIVSYFWKNSKEALKNTDVAFFSLIHSFMMFSAVMVITIGSAMAKRQDTDRGKFRTMLVWFSIALIIILIAIPWPFSPIAGRPYFR